MTPDELNQLIAIGYERPGVEFKSPGPCTTNGDDRLLVEKVVLAALGMANHRDGGLIIVGVAESSTGLEPLGLSPADMATWQFDRLADIMAPFAEPSVRFDMEIVIGEAKPFVVLRVHEFDDVPVLCRKQGKREPKLRSGACFVRPRRKPETSEIPTEADMRDLLELAVEKRLRRFLAQAQAAGLAVVQSPADAVRTAHDKQIQDFL